MTARLSCSDRELYARGSATLVASWQAYTRSAREAAIVRRPGVVTAVFPLGPEREVYNNAVLERGLDGPARGAAVAAMEDVYRAAGVERFAAWVHEDDGPLAADLERRGYRLDETTRAMGLVLGDLAGAVRSGDAAAAVSPAAWSEDLGFLGRWGAPPGPLAGEDGAAFDVLLARRAGGEPVAAGIAFDHDGDCGVY